MTHSKLTTAELLFKRAQQMELDPSWVTRGGVFAVTAHGREYYLNFAYSPLNSHTSASLATNKYLTRLILGRHGMTNIPFVRPRHASEASDFLAQYGKVVAKPVKGSGAHDIHIVTDPSQLQQLSLDRYILEQYILGKEMRYLVLNGQVIAVHQSDYNQSVDHDRPLMRISYDQSEWDQSLMESSVRVAEILGLNFAAVDYLVDQAGQAHILEVNSAPGMKWFHAPTSGPTVDVAGMFLKAIFKAQDTPHLHQLQLDQKNVMPSYG
jgi:glutathione synthase/RimK-type ligase-like ATP-grasp enzyme